MERRNRHHLLLAPVILALAIAGCSRAPEAPTDSQIASAIQAKLYQNAELKPLSIGVSSDQGVVTLTGAVNAPLEKLAVEDLAQKTAGVKQVVDQITVAQPASAPAASPASAEEKTAAPPEHHARRQPRERRRRVAEAEPQTAVQASAPASDAAPAAQAAPAPVQQPSQPAPPAPPPPLVVAAGTTVSVRMIDSISSATARVGQSFAASLAAPLVAGNQVAIPKGADATVRVVQVASAGRYSGRSELALTLVDVSYNGTDYPVKTGNYQKQGASRGKNTAEKVGGGAALGALLGAVIGHGKGAGIGAAVGGAAGTVAQTATRGQQVTVPTETKLDFVLASPLSVTQAGN